MFHVAIVVHRYDAFDKSDYLLRSISECWREDGIRVSVINDPQASIDADLTILHVNLTITPKEYLDCARRCAAVVNRDVSNISKRAISGHLLRRGDRYDGPVIVKTDRNHTGHPEKHLARKALASPAVRNYVGYFKEECRRARRWYRHGSTEAFLDYPVFDSIAAVPDAVWGDDDFVVERFLPERRDGDYCLRSWLFLGDHERHAIFYSHEPVIKSDNIFDYERLSEVPAELRQMRRDLKFEYGKFDYTMVQGRPILFDANRTPAMGATPEEILFPVARSLAGGIGAFLRTP